MSRHSAAVESSSASSVSPSPSARLHLPHMKPLPRHSQPSTATSSRVASRQTGRRSAVRKDVFGHTARDGSASEFCGESATGGAQPVARAHSSAAARRGSCQLETPHARIWPERTSASIVSTMRSTGVDGSSRCSR